MLAVFFLSNGIHLSGTCVLPTKNKTREGSLTTLLTSPTGRRALALTFKRDNTIQEGLGEELTEPDQGQAQKVIS